MICGTGLACGGGSFGAFIVRSADDSLDGDDALSYGESDLFLWYDGFCLSGPVGGFSGFPSWILMLTGR